MAHALARVAPLLSLLCIAVAGCSEAALKELCKGGACEVGECRDVGREGRVPVLMPDGRLAYAGQAIMLVACADGCHSSSAQGQARHGAPSGLDFDLAPVVVEGIEIGTELMVDDAAIEGLRERQLAIFERREHIYRAVVTGSMPYAPEGDAQRAASAGSTFRRDEASCALLEELGSIEQAATRELLRDWLACGAPLIEAQGPLDRAVGGTVGDQFPACPQEGPATFESVYRIMTTQGACPECHHPAGVMKALDLSTAAAAYDALLGADGKGVAPDCELTSFPYVTPADPERSYLLAKLGALDAPACGVTMPPAGALPAESLALVRAWIAAGAPPP
jgi:hypothetical protein